MLMTITVKFFASLRESVGRSDGLIPGADIRTVRDVWQSACPGLAMPANTLMAVNMEYVKADNPVRDGDEVAFFPPVTGG
jgi:molybdopterin synthase sulfur carrier subunit